VKTSDGSISYHPCLVSVKCWDSIQLTDMKNAHQKMEDYLTNHRPGGRKNDKSTTAFCLLLVIGTSDTSMTVPKQQGSFPHKDTYITVVVPSGDKFEINKTIENMAGASHIAELLASHSFAYAEKNHEKALQSKAKKDYKELGKRLLEDKQKLLQDHKNE
jgi:hypothetical protein